MITNKNLSLDAFSEEMDKKEDKESFMAKQKILSEWQIKEKFIRKGYKSILFVNSKRRQLVLAFRGVQLEVSDFFLADSQITVEIKSMLENSEIAPQTIYAYMDTCKAVELSNLHGYSLSFTGYAFGAWIAEQCVFFCHRDFDRKRDNVRAVTFDSPGSLEYLEKLNTTNILGTQIDLTDLDVIQYLNEPSFVNTFNKHLPQFIRVYSNSKRNYALEAETIFLDFVERIPSKIVKETMKKLFEQHIKPKMKRFSFYISGIKAIFNNNLNCFLDQFDPITQCLKNDCYKKMKNWPKTEFKPSNDLQSGITERINSLIEAGIGSIPHVPATVTKIGAKIVTFFTAPVINCICDNLLSGVTCIINLIIEFLSGNVKSDQCLDCFENDENIMEYPEENKEIFANEKRFKLEYNSNYRVQTDLICFKEEKLKKDNIGSLDFYLIELPNVPISEFDRKISPFVMVLLKKFRNIFEVTNDEKNYILKARPKFNFDVEKIKSNLNRIFMIDPNLKKLIFNFRETLIQKAENNDSRKVLLIGDKFTKMNHFVGRLDELEKLDECLQGKGQIVYIHGRSGCGKTTLAEQFAVKMNERPNHIVRVINAQNKFSIENGLKNLAGDVIEKDENLDDLLEDGYRKLKRILNKYLEHNKLKLFLVCDDLKKFENDQKQKEFKIFLGSIQSGFDTENVKFIITTKIEKLNFDFEEIELIVFNKDSCMNLITKRNLNKPDYEWEKVLKNMSGDQEKIGILPQSLEKILSQVMENPYWNYKEIVKYIDNEKEKPFSFMKRDSRKLFNFIACLSLLEGRNISYDLIRAIFGDENDLDYKVTNLTDLSLLKYDREKQIFVIHETTQSDIQKTGLSDQTLEESLNKIILALDNLLDMNEIREDKVKLNKKNEALLNHCVKILKHEMIKKIENKNLESLTGKIGEIMENIVLNYDEAVTYLKMNLEQKRKVSPNDKESIADTLIGIGKNF